jgi:hypothetical protein
MSRSPLSVSEYVDVEAAVTPRKHPRRTAHGLQRLRREFSLKDALGPEWCALGMDPAHRWAVTARHLAAGVDALLFRRTWLIIGVAVGLVAAHSWVFKPVGDFGVFYNAGRRLFRGEPLYFLEALPFKYAPPVALLLAPLGLLPEAVARLIWLVFSAAAVVRFQWLSARLTHCARPSAHLVVLVLVSPFIQVLLSWGQCDAILLLLMIQSELWADERPWISGALWAVACLFKPPYLIFLCVALPLRQWRRLSGLMIALLGGVSTAALRSGIPMTFAQHLAWLNVLRQTTPALFCAPTNQSAFGIACAYWTRPSNGRAFFIASTAISAAVFLFHALATIVTWRRDSARGRTLATALQFHLTAFMSPLGWRANLLSAAPLAYLLLSSMQSNLRWPPRVALIGLLAMTVGFLGYEVVGPDVFRRLLLARYLGLAIAIAALAAGTSQVMLALTDNCLQVPSPERIR